MYLDVDLLTATKVLAATGGRSESQVLEDALRAYLRAGQMDAARSELGELMDRLASGGGAPDDEEAMAVAVAEVGSVRARRRRKPA